MFQYLYNEECWITTRGFGWIGVGTVDLSSSIRLCTCARLMKHRVERTGVGRLCRLTQPGFDGRCRRGSDQGSGLIFSRGRRERNSLFHDHATLMRATTRSCTGGFTEISYAGAPPFSVVSDLCYPALPAFMFRPLLSIAVDCCRLLFTANRAPRHTTSCG